MNTFKAVHSVNLLMFTFCRRLELTNEKTLHSQVNNTTKEEGKTALKLMNKHVHRFFS